MKFLFTSLVLHLLLFLLFNLVQPNYGEKYGGLQHSGLHPPSLAQFQSMIMDHKWTDCLNWATIVTHNPKSLKNRYGYYLQHFLIFPQDKNAKKPLRLFTSRPLQPFSGLSLLTMFLHTLLVSSGWYGLFFIPFSKRNYYELTSDHNCLT